MSDPITTDLTTLIKELTRTSANLKHSAGQDISVQRVQHLLDTVTLAVKAIHTKFKALKQIIAGENTSMADQRELDALASAAVREFKAPVADDRPIIAYRLEPVYEVETGSWSSAACMVCAMTGEYLEGSGGGGTFLSPKIAALICAKQVQVKLN